VWSEDDKISILEAFTEFVGNKFIDLFHFQSIRFSFTTHFLSLINSYASLPPTPHAGSIPLQKKMIKSIIHTKHKSQTTPNSENYLFEETKVNHNNGLREYVVISSSSLCLR
jgi:hypothetical protein